MFENFLMVCVSWEYHFYCMAYRDFCGVDLYLCLPVASIQSLVDNDTYPIHKYK